MKYLARIAGPICAIGVSTVSGVAVAGGPKYGFADWASLLEPDREGEREEVHVWYDGARVVDPLQGAALILAVSEPLIVPPEPGAGSRVRVYRSLLDVTIEEANRELGIAKLRSGRPAGGQLSFGEYWSILKTNHGATPLRRIDARLGADLKVLITVGPGNDLAELEWTLKDVSRTPFVQAVQIAITEWREAGAAPLGTVQLKPQTLRGEEGGGGGGRSGSFAQARRLGQRSVARSLRRPGLGNRLKRM
jgi:hypothetical protein